MPSPIPNPAHRPTILASCPEIRGFIAALGAILPLVGLRHLHRLEYLSGSKQAFLFKSLAKNREVIFCVILRRIMLSSNLPQLSCPPYSTTKIECTPNTGTFSIATPFEYVKGKALFSGCCTILWGFLDSLILRFKSVMRGNSS